MLLHGPFKRMYHGEPPRAMLLHGPFEQMYQGEPLRAMLHEPFERMYQGEERLGLSFGVPSWSGLSLTVSQHGGCRVGKSRQVEYAVICQELHHMGRWQVSRQGLRVKQVGRENRRTIVRGGSASSKLERQKVTVLEQ